METLFKFYKEKIELGLSRLSPARRIFLSFALVSLLESLLLCLPPLSKLSSRATYILILFSAVSAQSV